MLNDKFLMLDLPHVLKSHPTLDANFTNADVPAQF